MANKDWIGGSDCLTRVHCSSCLGKDGLSINWREGKRENIDPPREFFNMPEPVPCPYGVTLEAALLKDVETRAADFRRAHDPFLLRLRYKGTDDDVVEALAEYVNDSLLDVETAQEIINQLEAEPIVVPGA